MTFILDGKKDTKFHCKINEITKNVVQRGLKQLGISEEIKKDDLVILSGRRINLDISIKDNAIVLDGTWLLMISDIDIWFKYIYIRYIYKFNDINKNNLCLELNFV